MNIEKIVLAFLMPLAFVACLEDNSLVTNAPSNEPPNEFSNETNASSSSEENIPVSSSSSLIDEPETVYRGIEIYSSKKSGLITIFELDSVTLDTTRLVGHGNRYPIPALGDTGYIADSLSVKSPYVKIVRTDSYSRTGTLYNIVDLRQSNAFAISKKTTFESIRTVHLMKSGMKFADAKKQASKEILQTFGTYSDSFDKDEVENIKNQDYAGYIHFIDWFVQFSTEDTIATYFEKCGNITCDKEYLKKRYITEAADLVRQGLTPFLGNFYAQLIDAGTCTAEKEGESFETVRSTQVALGVTLNCLSGEWRFMYKQPEHTMGTMTDERDGKTYKTVTYNLNGTTQTWMAENLAYITDGPQVPCEDDSIFCGSYFVESALNMDTSLVYPSVESCMEYEYELCDWYTEEDSMSVREICDLSYRFDLIKSIPQVDSVMAEKGVYQGICPDGWHIPTMEEINTLFDYLLEWYNPFIPKEDRDLEQDDLRYRVREAFFITPLGDPIGFGMDHEYADFLVIDGSLPVPYHFTTNNYLPNVAFVRCIKD